MELLEKKILAEGKVYPGDVLKVDQFLNHQMDVDFLCLLGKEFYERFKDCGVNKILTIEASGIGIACLTAQFFHCPVLFAKKSKTANLSADVWTSHVHSYTHNTDSSVIVSRNYLSERDRVLVVDDFLARGSAMSALTDICAQAGATVVGLASVVEKVYQGGGNDLRDKGFRVESLAKIASLTDDGKITFC